MSNKIMEVKQNMVSSRKVGKGGCNIDMLDLFNV